VRLAPRDVFVLLPRIPRTCAVLGDGGDWDHTLAAWSVERAPRADADLVIDVRRRIRAADAGFRVARAGGGVEVRPTRWLPSFCLLGRVSAVPAAIAAMGEGELERARFDEDPRRRAALFTPDAIVKVPRDPGQRDRGEAEQQTLRALLDAGVGAVPRPLGAGTVGALAWSAESIVRGAPLAAVTDPARGKRLLEQVARWLTDLAARTASTRAFEPLPLRGEHVAVGAGVPDGVQSVLVHGDLASALNVLVDGDRHAVIDWETARRHGPPLVDLLPLLCLGMARLRGARGAEAEAAIVLALCRGDDRDSAWLFDLVRACAAASGVHASAVGALASLAWSYQASMRLVHEELVRAAGGTPVAWVSAAEHVARAWSADPVLGAGWSALVGAP
jgi:hypothetical protein